MTQYHKILWSEGLFLTQHHFQQFDAFHERDRSFVARALVPFAYGASLMSIEADAIGNRLFTLTEFEGILPDGTTVRAPAVDDPPPPRSFEGLFAPTEKVLSVFLALPRIRPGVHGVRMDEHDEHGSPTRFQRAFTNVADEVTGEDEREIPYLKKRLTILFSGEGLEGYDYMKIAEIERNAEGVPQLRNSYVPPLLAVKASGWLASQLQNILELASAKSLDLAENVRQRTEQITEVSTVDLPAYLRLHTINAYIPTLVHMHNYPDVHPVQLFDHLARFVGNLCAFKRGEHPRDIPIYRHDDLEACYVELLAKLRDLITFGEIQRFTRVPLNRIDPSRFESDKVEAGLFDTSDFYLGVKSEASESRVAGEFPRHAKVISPSYLPRLIGSAIPGAILKYTQLPPASLPRKHDMVYFKIEPSGDRWDVIKRELQIAIYAPPQDFPGMEIECVAVER